jgi:DNA-binding GntR family transcriptional regulator
LQALFKAARENDHAQVRDLDVMLHRQIWEIADHHRLCNALNGLLTQVRMYVGVQTLTYSDLPAGISDHQILLEALRTQDIDLGLQMIRKHLGLAAEMVLDYYKKASSQ